MQIRLRHSTRQGRRERLSRPSRSCNTRCTWRRGKPALFLDRHYSADIPRSAHEFPGSPDHPNRASEGGTSSSVTRVICRKSLGPTRCRSPVPMPTPNYGVALFRKIAANRDARVFPDPNRFDIHRKPNTKSTSCGTSRPRPAGCLCPTSDRDGGGWPAVSSGNAGGSRGLTGGPFDSPWRRAKSQPREWRGHRLWFAARPRRSGTGSRPRSARR
jgi:hypothetical protein